MAPRGDRSAPTREAILSASARVFVRRGPYGATVREIAEAAGITVPAVYYHFEGVDQLYETLVREGRAHFRSMAECALAAPGDAPTRLRRLARTYARFSQEDTARLRLLCMELFRPEDPARDDPGARELRDWIDEQIAGLMSEALGGPDGHVARGARLFTALLGGLLVEQARDTQVATLDEDLAESAVELVLRGMAARGDREST